jgi:hypothetical protein
MFILRMSRMPISGTSAEPEVSSFCNFPKLPLAPREHWHKVKPPGLVLSPLWNRGEAERSEAGGCFRREKDPPVSLREPSPLFHRGDTSQIPSHPVVNGSAPRERAGVRDLAGFGCTAPWRRPHPCPSPGGRGVRAQTPTLLKKQHSALTGANGKESVGGGARKRKRDKGRGRQSSFSRQRSRTPSCVISMTPSL